MYVHMYAIRNGRNDPAKHKQKRKMAQTCYKSKEQSGGWSGSGRSERETSVAHMSGMN